MQKLTDIKGVGEKTKNGLIKLGINDVRDLISYIPRAYDVCEEPLPISKIITNKIISIEGIVISKPSIFRNGKISIITTFVQDGSGKIKVSWFNSPYIRKQIIVGRRYVFRGKAYDKDNKVVFNQPKVFTIDEYEKIKNKMLPVYHISKDIKNVVLRKSILNAFDELNEIYKTNKIDGVKQKDKNNSSNKSHEIINGKLRNSVNDKEKVELLCKDYLPDEILKKRNLYKLPKAYYHIHFPENNDDLLNARRRLVYDEFLLYQLGLNCFTGDKTKSCDEKLCNGKTDIVKKVIKNLPYKLTSSQIKVINDIRNDFNNKRLLNRLIQGDVGSGKTIVAFLSMIYMYENGFQSCMMAPTEVLAYQHYCNLNDIIKKSKLDIKLAFLSGSLSIKEKNNIKSKIKNGDVDIVIGTHALFTKDVVFENLGLMIVDEQQRFGVNQRKALEEKGENINIIHLSATPIPRTLSLLLFNGLSISKIDEKPNDRLYVKTAVISENERAKAYNLMLKEVNKGNRCFIVCPMIDDVKDDDVYESSLQNVKDYYKNLLKYFSNYEEKKINIDILHGKMKQKDKDKILSDFIAGKIDVLISTTVIEVGIDCKDATFIMIENAECFGLSTLHQLRGRVGRSDKQSYCVFVDCMQSEKSKKRLKVLSESNDGFYIAEKDMKMRGAGDVFGIKQSGDIGFNIGDIYNDSDILKEAYDDAKEILKDKNLFYSDKYALLSSKLDDYVKNGYTI